MKKNKTLFMAILLAFSISSSAQGFVKGAIVQYKGQDGKMIKGKFMN
jgi:hypothetical protein